MLIGILLTTAGISLLVLALVGASIEVYAQLLSALVQQRVSALTERLPEMLRPEGAADADGSEAAFGSTRILRSLIETLADSPLWLVLALVGIALIYSGLYITQRPRPVR